MSEARVKVSLTDGVLEFEGSETFVTSQVEKFTRIIQAAFAGDHAVADEAPRETPTSRDSVITEPPASLKGDQTSFVFGGRGKRQTLKLSAPGMQGTADLIARIRAAGNGIAAGRKGNGRTSAPTSRRTMRPTPQSTAMSAKSSG